MGAFIQLKEYPRSKRALFDLAIAGPLAGLVVAIPVLVLGLSLSEVGSTQNSTYTRSAVSPDLCASSVPVGESYSCPNDDLLEGNSLLYLGLKYLSKGALLPAPASYDLPVPLYWLRYLFTGKPVPIGGQDVLLHPVAMAGWAGLLVTFLNLVPAGQLDGGHILYAVFGARVRRAWAVILAFTLLLGFFWNGWWLWSALIFLLGRHQAEPLDQLTVLDPRRRALALLMLFVFLLVLTPVPFVTF